MVAAVRDIRSSFPHMGGIHAQDDDDEMYDEAGRVSFRTSGQEERANSSTKLSFALPVCLSISRQSRSTLRKLDPRKSPRNASVSHTPP